MLLQLDEPPRRRHPLLAELLVEGLGCMDVNVDADEVDERTRPERPPGAVDQGLVEVLGSD